MQQVRYSVVFKASLLIVWMLALTACSEDAPTTPAWIDEDAVDSVLIVDVGDTVSVPVEFVPGTNDRIAVTLDHTVQGVPTTVTIPYAMRVKDGNHSLVFAVTDSTRSGVISLNRNGKTVYTGFLKVMEGRVSVDTVASLWHTVSLKSSRFDSVFLLSASGIRQFSYLVGPEPLTWQITSTMLPHIQVEQYRDVDGHYLYASGIHISSPKLTFRFPNGQYELRFSNFPLPADIPIVMELVNEHGSVVYQASVTQSDPRFNVDPVDDTLLVCRLRTSTDTFDVDVIGPDQLIYDTATTGWFDLSVTLLGPYGRTTTETIKRTSAPDSVITTGGVAADGSVVYHKRLWGQRYGGGVIFRLNKTLPIPEIKVDGSLQLASNGAPRCKVSVQINQYIGAVYDTTINITVQHLYARVTHNSPDTVIAVIDADDVTNDSWLTWTTFTTDPSNPNRSFFTKITGPIGPPAPLLEVKVIRRRD